MTVAARTPLGQIARLFLRLGTTAFGGPAAHIAMMEEEVVRRRGWLTDARATMNVRSVLTPPRGGDAHPMRFYMKVTQRMRAMDKR